MKIVIVEEKDIHFFPPIMNIIEVLLDLGHEVTLIAVNSDNMPKMVMENPNYNYIKIFNLEDRSNQLRKYISRKKVAAELRSKTQKAMKKADVLWVSTSQTARDMWRTIKNYKYILQLMELTEYGFSTRFTRFPLDELSRKAWRNIVPERNRAYIQKVWWNLSSIPYVLPNKPYSIEYGSITEDMCLAINKMKNERKKIILYLGGFFADRDFNIIAKAVKQSKDYVLYIIGKAYEKDLKLKLDELIAHYNIEYLGYFDAPKHLAFVQYAHIGILPYKPVHVRGISDLNALYCAPNKIYEYAGFGIPMIGSDVIGLVEPFEKWGIGICWDEKNEESFYDAIKKVEEDYSTMSENCRRFYKSVDLHKIVSEILEE